MNKTELFSNTADNVDQEITLSVYDGGRPPYTVDLRSFHKDIITFGRGEDNDIVLLSSLASRRHGYIDTRVGIIVDCGSTNGLTINGALAARHDIGGGCAVRIDDDLSPVEDGVLLLFSGAARTAQWKAYPLNGAQKITIGRDSACDIRLEHVTISKRHAYIEREDGRCYITDNHSTNGVSVNGEAVRGKRLLQEKDVILLAAAKLIFTSEAIHYCCFASGVSLEALDIVKKVKTKKGLVTINNHISIQVKPCEFVAIIGGSGAGKSTFLNCISGYDRATSGQVALGGEDLYANFGAMKHAIGYVPQQDIVHDGLTLFDMLEYAAMLRMPSDMTAAERSARVRSVIDAVELTGRERVLIRRLSGGQRKRASIAIELLSDPGLFFLDEPSSGLDPGTERNLMEMLRRMAGEGKTIITVTHNIQNLHLCDKLVILGNGGNLCFFGTPEEALAFFDVDDLANVYDMTLHDPTAWKERYSASEYRTQSETNESRHVKTTFSASPRHPLRAARQLPVLIARYLKLIWGDKQKLAFLLLQAPLLALLISIVADGEQFAQYEMTKSILFTLACSAFWIGILNAIQEICKERAILRREIMTGLSRFSYVLSKFVVLGGLCLLQIALLMAAFFLLAGYPASGVILAPFFEMCATGFLTACAAAGMGLFVSALFQSPDRAMAVAPILLMPQILFSGLIFDLTGVTRPISTLIICRWAMEGFGSTADLNELPHKLAQQGVPLLREAEDFFLRTSEHMRNTWLILAVMIAVFAVGTYVALARVGRNRGR